MRSRNFGEYTYNVFVMKRHERNWHVVCFLVMFNEDFGWNEKFRSSGFVQFSNKYWWYWNSICVQLQFMVSVWIFFEKYRNFISISWFYTYFLNRRTTTIKLRCEPYATNDQLVITDLDTTNQKLVSIRDVTSRILNLLGMKRSEHRLLNDESSVKCVDDCL